MKASEARKMTNKNINKRMSRIYGRIKYAAKRGNSYIRIPDYKVSAELESRLVADGYKVKPDPMGLDYYIAW